MNTNAGSISYSCAGRFIGVPDPNLRPEDRRAPACKPTRLTILTEPGIEHQTVDYIRGSVVGQTIKVLIGVAIGLIIGYFAMTWWSSQPRTSSVQILSSHV